MAIEDAIEAIIDAFADIANLANNYILKSMGFSELETKKIKKGIEWLIIGALATALIGITIAYS